MGVDAKRGLVHDAVREGVPVAVVHLGLGGDGQELVRLAQQLRLGRRRARAVREDHRRRRVEDAEGVEEGGGAVDCGGGGGG